MEVNNLKIITTDWNQDASELTQIRKTVFVDEQHVPVEMELDDSDQQALHFLITPATAPDRLEHRFAQLHRPGLLAAGLNRPLHVQQRVAQVTASELLGGAFEKGLEELLEQGLAATVPPHLLLHGDRKRLVEAALPQRVAGLLEFYLSL